MESNNIHFLAGTDNRRDMKMGGQGGANNDGGLDSYPSALDPGCKPFHLTILALSVTLGSQFLVLTTTTLGCYCELESRILLCR